ncbi:MAG: alpha-keto acid decarboxylase family protein, partial [Proteobacteria bacterium]|nr:alpha-keto acid decarboxylase family protein [Pseudomonadota bacterium]
MSKIYQIGAYLIEQLHRHGVEHVFGIPGDYVLGFYDLMSRSDLVEVINTCDEQGAGFAADAYARIKGLGAVCITYGVGGLKVTNTTAQAFAEKSPVIIISGAPGVREQEKNPLLHHKFRDFGSQKKIFDEFTVASTVLDDPSIALQEIDRVIHAALKHKRPVYIELPRDMVSKEGNHAHEHLPSDTKSDQGTLKEAVAEAAA